MVTVQLQGKFQVRSAKPPKDGEGQFATLVEMGEKYPVQINVALPVGHTLNEQDVLDFLMSGTYRLFTRDGRSFVTLYVEDYRATVSEVLYKPKGEIGTKGGKALAGGPATAAAKS